MAIAETVESYLAMKGVDYDVIPHAQSRDSLQSAQAADVSGEGLAKAVVLKDDTGYFVAVIPATHKLGIDELYDQLRRKFRLADEDELSVLFRDCALGAVPPLADAYGLDAMWDDRLGDLETVYFEGGDHVTLVRISGTDFRKLMASAGHGSFSHHA